MSPPPPGLGWQGEGEGRLVVGGDRHVAWESENCLSCLSNNTEWSYDRHAPTPTPLPEPVPPPGASHLPPPKGPPAPPTHAVKHSPEFPLFS